MDEPLWYFGYGSNMCAAIFREQRGMRPLDVRTGWLDGWRICFTLPVGPGERGVANLEAAPDGRTHGVLYRLSRDDAERLDRTEGVHFGYYARREVEVVSGEERIPAFTYASTIVVAGRKPSARYLGLLVAGAREHGLPEDYVRLLEAIELAVDERLA